ncbi:hypothetical protein D1872_307700 [compost metagenome]
MDILDGVQEYLAAVRQPKRYVRFLDRLIFGAPDLFQNGNLIVPVAHLQRKSLLPFIRRKSVCIFVLTFSDHELCLDVGLHVIFNDDHAAVHLLQVQPILRGGGLYSRSPHQ